MVLGTDLHGHHILSTAGKEQGSAVLGARGQRKQPHARVSPPAGKDTAALHRVLQPFASLCPVPSPAFALRFSPRRCAWSGLEDRDLCPPSAFAFSSHHLGLTPFISKKKIKFIYLYIYILAMERKAQPSSLQHLQKCKGVQHANVPW